LASKVSILAGACPSRRGEGGEERRGKKDTGYLYKAFMVARVAMQYFLFEAGYPASIEKGGKTCSEDAQHG